MSHVCGVANGLTRAIGGFALAVAFADSFAFTADICLSGKVSPNLLLITVEGILHHHVLSRAHYRELYGRDVTAARLQLRTKKHLRKVAHRQ